MTMGQMGQYWLGPNKLSDQPEKLQKAAMGFKIFKLSTENLTA